MELTDFWFGTIAVLWIGYFFLEGFDFGVGVLLPVLGRTESDRRVMINTIGPVWDGNEVWVLVAGGATFAAFPEWYATLFSGFYLALLLILVALIVRGVAFEYRGKVDSDRWRANWDRAIFWGSALPALLWGVAFANIVAGVPIDKHHEYTGSLLTLLNPYGLLGGLLTLGAFTLHGAYYLALKTDGSVRTAANALARRLAPVVVVVAATFLLWGQFRDGRPLSWALTLLAAARAGRCGRRQLEGARGLGLRAHRHHAGAHRREPVRDPVPERDAVVDGRRLQPHRRQRLEHRLHAQGDDRRGARHHPGGAGLPGLDLLGVPQADQQPPHPCGAVAGACRAVVGGAQRHQRELMPACAPSTRGC